MTGLIDLDAGPAGEIIDNGSAVHDVLVDGAPRVELIGGALVRMTFARPQTAPGGAVERELAARLLITMAHLDDLLLVLSGVREQHRHRAARDRPRVVALN